MAVSEKIGLPPVILHFEWDFPHKNHPALRVRPALRCRLDKAGEQITIREGQGIFLEAAVSP